MDLVLRNARIIDRTGGPARDADVGVENGRIAAVGDVAANGATEVELDGLVLAPGFVDIHTHFDAQVLWDPDLTPSSWHGVTTVVMGNCGFGIAPTRPEHRSTIARTLENVEGMSFDALEAGIPWTFETFPEYLDTLDADRQAPQRRRHDRSHAAAPLRARRRRHRTSRHRYRGRANAIAGGRRTGRRRPRLRHVEVADALGRLGQARAQPHGRDRRGVPYRRSPY